MSDKKNNYEFVWVNMNAHKPPVFEEVKGKDYILYGAAKGCPKEWRNNYGGYLMSLYERSSKNRAIINGKSKYIAGRGWEIESGLSLQEQANLAVWLRAIRADKELPRISKDKVIFGGFYLEIIVNGGGDKVAEANHIGYNDLRIDTDGAGYFFTSDWSTRKPEQNDDYEWIPIFDPENPAPKSILAVNDYRPGLESYAVPSYVASNPYIEADAEIANYTLNNVKNGFSAGYMVVMYNGNPQPQEKAVIENMIKERFTGSDKAGNIVAVFADGKDKGVDILPIPTNGQEDKFINLNLQVREEIFTGHEVLNPMLFGIKDNTGLGNNADELRTANALFQNVYVTPEQNTIEFIYNELAEFSGLKKALRITELEPIRPQISSDILGDILTQDELRKEFGYVALADSQSQFNTQRAKNKDADYLEYFSNVGEDADKYEIIESVDLYCANCEEFGQIHEHATQKFALDRTLTDNELKVLGILNESRSIDIPEIAEITDIPRGEVSSIIDRLDNVGAIEVNVEGSEPTYEVTTDGSDAIEDGGLPVVQIKYRYAERSDAPPLKPGGTSRPFCKGLMDNPKLFTREEIDGAALATAQQAGGAPVPLGSVWANRGGWYKNPITGRTTPWCRHIWQQVIVRERN